ncbi:MAG: hypothetical protein HZA08_07590 [Nitrospirae bacterium]|nr:hypothetical protein [Nitrospirota bacterium]
MNNLIEMTGKRVRIHAGEIEYCGILIEVTEENIELQGDNQWITIPVNNVNSITLAGD